MMQRILAQAGMATAEQLLRMVDRLAEVDARMRWASNKRLHLELGIIQAVEGISQVSLSDVITAIDKAGGTAGEAAALMQARRAAVQPRPPEPSVVVTPQPVQPAPAEETTDLGEDLLLDVPESHQPTPPPTGELWASLVPQIRKERALIAGWAEKGTQLGFESGVLTIGFPESEATSVDNLQRNSSRQFIEDLLRTVTGQRVRIDFVVDSSLASIPDPEPELPAVSESAPVPQPEAPATGESFYQDPLIEAVLVQLEGRIAGRKFGGAASAQ
jgi:DNA polymerase-3 subunit gamma/tau